MNHPIAPLDLMWFVMETQTGPTHVGALLIFEKPAKRPGVVREIVDAYRSHRPTPPFSFVPEISGRGLPHFKEATDYDPCYHVQHIALPAGASYDDLLRLVADLNEPMLDRSRPLFRDWFIDNVPGNRFALYVKVHHAIIDGVSGMKRIHGSLSTGRRRSIPTPAFAADVPVRKPRPPKAVVDRLAELGLSATRQTLALRDVSVTALKKALTSLLGGTPTGSAPFTAHRGPMNAPLQMSRSVATLSLPLEEMHAVARRFGATLNDLAVTIVDEGVHRYLRGTGRVFPQRLVAFCPVSLREEGDATVGTRASAMFVHLGAHDATVAERIRLVVSALGEGKRELRSMSRDAAMVYAVALLGVAELTSATRVDRVTPPLANLVISNVPGGRDALYLNGARLAGMFPVSAIAMSVGLNATLTSYHDRMDFGFVGNGATMFDLPQLARHVGAAYAELKVSPSGKRKTYVSRKSRMRPGGA